MPANTRSADLARREVADAAQDVVQRVAPGRPRHLRAMLQVVLHARERARVDQLAQLLLAEQLAQQVPVERQRRRAALGAGRVALVHVGRDVVEQQRGGERRGGPRLDLDERDLAGVQAAQQLLQARHVEHVAQALAVGLEDDREVRVAAGHLEQVLGLQALLPQRRAPARVGARDQQRARGVLAKARAEQGRAAELGGDRLLDLLGVEQHQLRRRGQRLELVRVEVGQVQRRSRRRTRSRPPRGRGARGSAPTARAPRRRGRGRRRARGRTCASRRSRRGSARRRSCGRSGSTRVAACCSRR